MRRIPSKTLQPRPCRLPLLLASTAILLLCAGCGTKYILANNPDKPELRGQLQLVTTSVKVHPIGSEQVGGFDVPKPERKFGFFQRIKQVFKPDIQEINSSGYIVTPAREQYMHLRNTKVLQDIANDPDGAKLIEKYGK